MVEKSKLEKLLQTIMEDRKKREKDLVEERERGDSRRKETQRSRAGRRVLMMGARTNFRHGYL